MKNLWIFAALIIAGCGDSLPRNVDSARIGLWTEYHENVYTAKCDAIEEMGEWFIVCKNDAAGGVYWINSVDDNHYVVHAVNGRAKVHSNSFTKITTADFYLNGSFPNAEKAWLSLVEKI
ncbi:hypothetical protein MRM63_07535 [bacterium 19MO03SA05]|uniref:Lipoprotein n=1 Tax=bacterium 19MO03SA05 TaxID=2920620 RepID=A0AAU6VAX7_UNCXX